MRGISIICEELYDGVPIRLYCGVPDWKTEFDEFEDNVHIPTAYGRTSGSLSDIVRLSVSHTSTILHVYMIIDNKLHHWITKRNYAPYGEGLSRDIDGMFTLTAGGGYLFSHFVNILLILLLGVDL